MLSTEIVPPRRIPDPDIGIFRYVLALTSTDEPPQDESAKPGEIRRRIGGGFWIYDGEAWAE